MEETTEGAEMKPLGQQYGEELVHFMQSASARNVAVAKKLKPLKKKLQGVLKKQYGREGLK